MWGESLTLTSAVRTTLWPLWICPRATTSTSFLWTATGCWIPTGWVEAANPSFKETAAPPIMFSPVRQLQRPRPGWLITPSRWRGRTSKCSTRSGSTRRNLQTSQVVLGFKPLKTNLTMLITLASHCYSQTSGGKPPASVHYILQGNSYHYQTDKHIIQKNNV